MQHIAAMIAQKPATWMTIMYIGAFLIYKISAKTYDRRQKKALAAKLAQDMLDLIAYHAEKPVQPRIRIRFQDKTAMKNAMRSGIEKSAPTEQLEKAVQDAVLCEACRVWLDREIPRIKSAIKKLPGPARPGCRAALEQAVYNMPSDIEIEIYHVRKSGKPSKPKYEYVPTDMLISELARRPGHEKVPDLISLVRKQVFQCAHCETTMDECRNLILYEKPDGNHEARCPKCMFED